MYLAATQYILGFRPDYKGIVIDPCVPTAWEGFSVSRVCKDTLVELKVGKMPCDTSRVCALIVDGVKLDSNVIPYSLIAEKEKVSVEAIWSEN